REALAAVGFTGKKGQTYLVAGDTLTVLVGVEAGITTLAELRDAVASFTRAAKEIANLTVDLRGIDRVSAEEAGQAVAEGTVLSRYRFDELTTDPKTVALESVTVIVEENRQADVASGVERGQVLARAASLARDLANTPP